MSSAHVPPPPSSRLTPPRLPPPAPARRWPSPSRYCRFGQQQQRPTPPYLSAPLFPSRARRPSRHLSRANRAAPLRPFGQRPPPGAAAVRPAVEARPLERRPPSDSAGLPSPSLPIFFRRVYGIGAACRGTSYFKSPIVEPSELFKSRSIFPTTFKAAPDYFLKVTAQPNTPSTFFPNSQISLTFQLFLGTKHTYDEQPACSGVAIHEHRPSRLPINDCRPSHPSLIAQSSLVVTITSYRTASASWTVNAGLGNITIFLAHGQFLGKNQIRRYRWPLERRGGLELDAGLLLLAPSLGRPRRHCAPPLLAIADLARADASAPVTRRSRRRRRCRPSPSPSYPAAEAPATSSQGAGSPTGNQAQDFSSAELPRRRRHQAPSSPPPSSRMRMKMETV